MSYFPIDRPMHLAQRANKLRGVHLAIVDENKDGDGNPGYRVKVKFPWLNDQEKTYWARIAVPMAGKDRGTYFLPEKDDQLLVVFEHGDVDRPIVIGAAWSKKQEWPEVNESAKNQTKMIKSRCGHRVIFDDKDGAEKVTVVDKTKKNKIVLDPVNKLIKIECDGDIEIKAAANVILHAKTLKMGTKDKLTMKSKQFLMHAKSSFGFKAGGDITVSGSQCTINVNNAPAAQVSGSGTGELGAVATEKAKDQVKEKQAAAGAAGGGAAGGAAGGAGGPAAGGSGGGSGGSSGGGGPA
ncbi:MAG: hypothetical protein H0T46_35215, partial [Deltaproteobacteria bacterium]|nr:hypothetical protein [Deltaproteobacteria bacterium]